MIIFYRYLLKKSENVLSLSKIRNRNYKTNGYGRKNKIF